MIETRGRLPRSSKQDASQQKKTKPPAFPPSCWILTAPNGAVTGSGASGGGGGWEELPATAFLTAAELGAQLAAGVFAEQLAGVEPVERARRREKRERRQLGARGRAAMDPERQAIGDPGERGDLFHTAVAVGADDEDGAHLDGAPFPACRARGRGGTRPAASGREGRNGRKRERVRREGSRAQSCRRVGRCGTACCRGSSTRWRPCIRA